MPKFNARQQLLTRGNYVETSTQVLYSRLEKLNPTPVGRNDVVGYAENDTMLTRFLTMYATARWGEGITMIQYRVGHRSVPNYSKRKEVDFRDVPYTYYTSGFRKPIFAGGDAQKAFDRYVEKAPKDDFVTVKRNAKGEVVIEGEEANQ